MRVSLNLSEEMLARVDQEAKRLGTSRGAMLTTWIGEKINNLDMSRQFTEAVQSDFASSLKGMIMEALSNEDIVKNLATANEITSEEFEKGIPLFEDPKKEVKKRGKK